MSAQPRPAEREEPVFLYDFNSPYAYLAASRVDAVLPVRPRWQPVALAFLLRAHDRRPWSMRDDERPAGVAECERRARAYGLPPMRWPPGWPVESYGLTSLRAALVAEEHGLLRPFSQAAFARSFVDGLGIRELSDVLAVAESVGLDPEAVEVGVSDGAIKERLARATADGLDAGVVGVPTVIVDGTCFWGDDQLPAASSALG